MPRPGTQIDIVDSAAFGGAVLDSGQAFFIGVAERGLVGQAALVTSLGQYAAKYGVRAGGSLLYDSVAAFFAEGGARLYCSRISAAGALQASAAFGGNATCKAASPGTWGNSVVATAAWPPGVTSGTAGDPIVVNITYQGSPVETSAVCATVDDLVAWAAARSDYVRFVKGAGNVLPASGTVATLVGGTTLNTIDATTVAAALAAFDYGLGPGQIAAPGLTTLATQQALLAHANTNRRNALIDLPDSSDPTTLTAAVVALRSTLGVRFSAAFAPWVSYPGQTPPAVVQIPYSGLQAGLIGRLDAQTQNPNAPAAGVNGISRYALGLTQTYTDAQRQSCNDSGVCMAVVKYGTVRTYGYRTAAGPADTNWLWFGGSREINALAREADAIAENYVLRQIDGQGTLFASLHSDLKGLCLRHWQRGALYGATSDDAFNVDTGPSINTPASIAAGEVHAVIRVKTSPSAEWVQISIVKVPVELAIAA